jgi:hypothetical protein
MRVKHSKFKDCELIVKVETDGKMLVLVKDPYPSYNDVKPDFYTYWGNAGESIQNYGRTLLRTKSGRKISQSRAVKILHKMIAASKQLTFSKL